MGEAVGGAAGLEPVDYEAANAAVTLTKGFLNDRRRWLARLLADDQPTE